MARTTVSLCLLLLVSCSLSLAADWPNFLGPDHNGVSPETGFNKDWQNKPPRVLWQTPLGDGGFAGPSVADGKVFIIDHSGDRDILKALDLETGRPLWQQYYPDTAKSNYGFARSTPSYSDGKVYAAGRLGQLVCCDAATGKGLWGKNLLRDFGGRNPQWDYAGSPLIDGDKLVVCTGAADGNVLALNKNTGETIWTGGNGDTAGYATPVKAQILGRDQYVVFAADSVEGVDAESGRLLWEFKWTTEYAVNAPQPIVAGNYIFVTSGYNSGCAVVEITAQGPQQRWRNKNISSHFSSPIFYNGYIYSNTDPGNLVCLNPRDGEIAWRQGGVEKGGLLIADGVIIAVGGKSGDVLLARAIPDKFEPLGVIKPLGGQSWTAPILANGRLLVRNTSALACLDLR